MIYAACKIIPRSTKAISILRVSQRTKRLNDFTDLCIQASVKTFLKHSFRNTTGVSNSLDPDQARLKVVY